MLEIQTKIERKTAAIELSLRRDARDSLLKFTQYMQHSWRTGVHHQQICEALEAVERGDIRRLLIETPPRHSKSELASKKFPAWFLGRNPDKQILAASYSAELATDFGREVRNMVRESLYQKLFPGTELSPDSQAAGKWHTSQGGVYIAAGVGGSITGRGAHVAIIDDPIKNREEADSERVRDAVWKWYTSTLLTRIMPGGAIVLIMTRWHEDDLAGRVVDTERWERVCLPAIANEGSDFEEALWPEWYPLEELRAKRDVMVKGGRARDWQALYQQNPTPEEGGYIKEEWFKHRYGSAPPCNVYMASDFAVTASEEGKDPDFTEHGVFGIGQDGKIYVLDWWNGQTTSDVWIESLLDLVEKHKPACWFGEGGVIRRAIEPHMLRRCRERRVHFRKEWITPIADKAIRGRSFQARAASETVVFPVTAWAERVIAQCCSFGAGLRGHDDAFDVLSLMCRCIDQAHPAIAAARGGGRERVNRYGEREVTTSAWKVV